MRGAWQRKAALKLFHYNPGVAQREEWRTGEVAVQSNPATIKFILINQVYRFVSSTEFQLQVVLFYADSPTKNDSLGSKVPEQDPFFWLLATAVILNANTPCRRLYNPALLISCKKLMVQKEKVFFIKGVLQG